MTYKELAMRFDISVEQVKDAILKLGIKLKRGSEGIDFSDEEMKLIEEQLIVVSEEQARKSLISTGRNLEEIDENEIIEEIEKEELEKEEIMDDDEDLDFDDEDFEDEDYEEEEEEE